MRSRRRVAGRIALGAGLTLIVAVLGLVPAAPAAAHVTAVSEDAVPGSQARVVFRMPNESDANASDRLEIHLLPEGAPPIASALTVPVPGWSAEVTYEELAEPIEGAHGEQITESVSTIVWTADDPDAAIQPGEIGEFPVQIGPLPEVEQLYFPALQSYAGVDEPVRWISRPDPDGAEPPDPAPVLRLAAPDEDSGPGDSPEGGDDSPDEGTAGDGATGDGAAGDGAAGGAAGTWLGLAGLVAGLAGLGLGGAAYARTRRTGAG